MPYAGELETVGPGGPRGGSGGDRPRAASFSLGHVRWCWKPSDSALVGALAVAGVGPRPALLPVQHGVAVEDCGGEWHAPSRGCTPVEVRLSASALARGAGRFDMLALKRYFLSTNLMQCSVMCFVR